MKSTDNVGRDHITKGPDEVLRMTGSSLSGLAPSEAEGRLETYGPNEIPTRRKNFFVRLAPQIFDFVIILLVVIAAILALLAFLFPENESTSFETSVAIVSVIILSWGLIVFQMYSAERSLDALRDAAAPKARVKRGGKWTEIPTGEVVPGDIILLQEGDRIPADARVIRGKNLLVDESSLSGESVSLEKNDGRISSSAASIHEMTNTVFMSTLVTRGRGTGVVVGTGLNSELGRIARDMEEAEEPAIPLQKKMSQLARTLSIILLSLVLLLTLVQIGRLYMNGDLTMDSVMEQVVDAVILSVVAVPWSFPIITTSVMARGMLHLVKENAIVRRIASVEGLGRVSVICSDKTGTLTMNQMTVTFIHHDGRNLSVTGSGYVPEGEILDNGILVPLKGEGSLREMMVSVFLNNNARLLKEDGTWKVIGDPTEGALITLGNKSGVDEVCRGMEKLRELPFDSDRKMMTTVVQGEKGFNVLCKGGFEQILERCTGVIRNGTEQPLTDAIRKELYLENERASEKALRTLAVAGKRLDMEMGRIDEMPQDVIEKDLVFQGIVGMMDPPKKGVKEAVARCRTAGIDVVMITGDSRGTASAIAGNLGIMKEGDLVVEGKDLPVPEEDLPRVRVFSRVSPGQKVDIVKAYRKKGKIIAMTGDGMNDAAALKNADVGVAMGRSGVDVAKEASQIVLSDDNFATLVTAIHRGRQIFDNIQKSITYQIYTNISELAIMFFGSLLFVEQMMGDRHLLFLYFSTHIFPVAALVLDRTTTSVMKEPPRNVKEGIVSRKVLGNLSVMILAMSVIALVGYRLLETGTVGVGLPDDGLNTIQTMVLTFVVSAECINLFNSLSMKDSLVTQVRERNMVLPVLMALIPMGSLTFLMYVGDLGDSLDLARLTALQFSVSILSGLLIIPVVELFKVLVIRSGSGSRPSSSTGDGNGEG